MATEHDQPLTYAEAPDAWWAAVLEVAQAQLCEVLDEVTQQARREVNATAAALARRETEVNAMAAALAAQAEELDGEAKSIADLHRSAEERERVVEHRLKQAQRTSADATKALSEAMARSAALVAETETRVAERQTEAENLIRQTIEDATTRAEEIVATALASTDYSRAALRDLSAAIDQFLVSDKFQAVEYNIDLREHDGVDQNGGADAGEQRVSDAVKRAVQGWTSGRHQAS